MLHALVLATAVALPSMAAPPPTAAPSIVQPRGCDHSPTSSLCQPRPPGAPATCPGGGKVWIRTFDGWVCHPPVKSGSLHPHCGTKLIPKFANNTWGCSFARRE